MYPVGAHAGLMRCARAEIIPQVPTLAPQLEENQTVIRTAIAGVLESRGLNPEQVPEANYNKVERQALAGFLIQELREDLVEGTGNEAEFKDFKYVTPKIFSGKGRLRIFRDGLEQTMLSAAVRVEDKFACGDDPEHTWLPVAQRRHVALGKIALAEAPNKWYFSKTGLSVSRIANIPIEGRDLHDSLRTPALSSFMGAYLGFVRKYKAPAEKRTAAAHELLYVMTSTASLHGLELFTSLADGFSKYKGKIVQDEKTGVHGVAFPEGTPRKRRNTYSRVRQLPNAKMKCPAHVDTLGDGSTNLEVLAHATINAAQRHGIL